MQHFFLPREAFQNNFISIEEPGTVHQIYRVLRMKKEDEIVVLDGSGMEWRTQIMEISPKKILARLLERKKNEAEPSIEVTLFQAIPKKKELFELIVQKGTELGVARFVPITTEFGQSESLPRPPRLLRIIQEAAEQCERGRIPSVEKEISFEQAIRCAGEKILFHSRSGDHGESLPHTGAVSLFIGPEGGFSPAEISLAASQHATVCSLGKRILRMETAAIAACALVLLNVK